MESLTGLGLWPSRASCPQVSVHVSPVEGLCLAGGGGLAQQVQVPAGSARPVGFSVVPIAAAAVSLKVVARGSLDFPVGDAISKILQVEVNGTPLNLGPQLPDSSPGRELWPSPCKRAEATPQTQCFGPLHFPQSWPHCVPEVPTASPEECGLGGAGSSLCDLSQLRFPSTERRGPSQGGDGL